MIFHTHFLSPIHSRNVRLALDPRRIVKLVLRSEKKMAGGEIHLIFVDKKTIRRLNRQFLGVRGNTDVIAFPYGPKGPTNVCGDIFICVPVARANASRYDEPFGREMTRLIVHGTLHLLGYADHPAKARKKMWDKQERLVDGLWNKNFYGFDC